MYNPYSLENKTILVTGASSGIGKSIAIECSKLGACVILIGRNKERLKETYNLMLGDSHSIIDGDICEETTVDKIVTNISNIDGIVYCAGINDKCIAKALTKEKINKVFDTNVFSPMLMTKALLKNKKINKECSIVMISSISSYYAAISNTMYAASKGALESFIRVLAVELSSKKVRVNGIRPGVIKTPILQAYTLKEEFGAFEKIIPLGRVGKPEEIAYGVIYLLSDAAKWVTGTIFNIDGGITLR